MFESFRRWRHYLEGARYPSSSDAITRSWSTSLPRRWSPAAKCDGLRYSSRTTSGSSIWKGLRTLQTARADALIMRSVYTRRVANLLAACTIDSIDAILPAIKDGEKRDEQALDTLASITQNAHANAGGNRVLQHTGLKGNEQAGQRVREAAALRLLSGVSSDTATPFLGSEATQRWREDIKKINSGRRVF